MDFFFVQIDLRNVSFHCNLYQTWLYYLIFSQSLNKHDGSWKLNHGLCLLSLLFLAFEESEETEDYDVRFCVCGDCRYKSLKDLKDEIFDRHANLQDLSSGLVELSIFISISIIIYYLFLTVFIFSLKLYNSYCCDICESPHQLSYRVFLTFFFFFDLVENTVLSAFFLQTSMGK